MSCENETKDVINITETMVPKEKQGQTDIQTPVSPRPNFLQ